MEHNSEIRIILLFTKILDMFDEHILFLYNTNKYFYKIFQISLELNKII